MTQQLTQQFILKNKGCYSTQQVLTLFPKDLTLLELLNVDFSLKDKYWFVCKKLATKQQNQQIAIGVAEIILPIYETKYPNDLRPREAIEAAKLYITGHISLDSILLKRNAATAAAYAATAAYAAYAATAAATAADTAAYAAYDATAATAAAAAATAADTAAYAAYDATAATAAAAYAAYAATAAAYADTAGNATYKAKLLTFLIDFCKEAY